MSENPAKLAGSNPQPSPRTVRAFTVEEIKAIAAELPPMYAPLPAFAAATVGFAHHDGARSRTRVAGAPKVLNRIAMRNA